MRIPAFASLAFFACWLVPKLAYAQMSEGERKAAARAAYGEGIDLQDKGKPAEALGRFDAAEKLFDAPTHLLHIAECQALTGKLVEASETYETLEHKSLPSGSPDAFVQAQETGKTELAALKPRIPTLRVIVKPEPQKLTSLQITLNDRQMPVELVGIARPINPGTYRLTASATGWATPTPATVDVPEAEAKTVELTLQQGAVAAVVAPPPTAAPSPPPYDANQPPPKPGPSSTGLLVGGHVGLVVPGGDADKTTKMESVASAGPGFGVDLFARVAKVILVGGTLDVAALGAPDSNTIPAGTKADVSTTSVYLGILLGVIPRSDKVSFVADVGLGYRMINESITVTSASGGASPKSTLEYGGAELGLDVGVSFPIGPTRLVPKAGVQIGSFGSRSCTGNTAPCGTTVDSSAHSILTVNLALYYDVDLGKKSGAAASLRGSAPVF